VLDWLRDTITPRFAQKGADLFRDPWRARNEYIKVILDRRPENVDRFFQEQAARELSPDQRIVALKLMEMQRHAMLMYTSCGWFFDELSGLETTQIIQYAARTIQLYEEIFEESLEPAFLERLELAKSNIPENKDGRVIYERYVRPAMVDRQKVAAHYALSSLFDPYPEEARIYCYEVQLEDFRITEAGRAKLGVGRALITSQITREADLLSFGALHMGDHLMNAGVRAYQGEEDYNALKNELVDPFNRADFPEVLRILDRHFGESTYSLRSIFHDDQRKILNTIMKSTLADAEAVYRRLYDTHAPMMRFVSDLRVPQPRAFLMAAEFAINSSLRTALEDPENLDFTRINVLLEEARVENIPLDGTTLGFTMKKTMRRLSERLLENPYDIELLKKLETAAGVAQNLPFEVNIWRTQNNYYEMLQKVFPEQVKKAEQGDTTARQWVDHFVGLGRNLAMKVDQPAMPELQKAA